MRVRAAGSRPVVHLADSVRCLDPPNHLNTMHRPGAMHSLIAHRVTLRPIRNEPPSNTEWYAQRARSPTHRTVLQRRLNVVLLDD